MSRYQNAGQMMMMMMMMMIIIIMIIIMTVVSCILRASVEKLVVI